MEQKLLLSKLDVVKRQLETGIRLYFGSDDPVSIHTLTAAAYNVLRDIDASRGGKKMFAKDRILDYVKDGHKNEVRAALNKAENFFKHADRDSDAALDFNPAYSEYLLAECCEGYRLLTGESPPVLNAYIIWFIVSHPSLFILSDVQKRALFWSAQDAQVIGRARFFELTLPRLTTIGTQK